MQQVYPNHKQAARPCQVCWLLLRQGRISPMIGIISDGWLPNRITPAEAETSRGTLGTLARQAGRVPAGLSISVYGQAHERPRCQRFHDAGVTRVIIRSPTASTTQEMAEEVARIAEAVIR